MSYIYVGRDNYIALITKHLNNKLSTSELGELNAWLSESYSNQNVVNEVKTVWSSVGSYKSEHSFDADSAYQNFISKYEFPTYSSPKSAENNTLNSAVRYFLVALTLLLLLLGGLFLNNKLNSFEASKGKHEYANLEDKAITIPLFEGSTALLEPKSKISFNKLSSEVTSFEGQGLFNLAKLPKDQEVVFDLDKDLSIASNRAVFKVSNTANSENIETNIEKGRVALDIKGEVIELRDGQSLIYNKIDGQHKIVQPKKEEVIINKEMKLLSFNNTPLERAFEAIEEYYDVEVKVADGNIPDVHFTAFNLKSIDLKACIELLQHSIPMNVSYSGNTVIVKNIQE